FDSCRRNFVRFQTPSRLGVWNRTKLRRQESNLRPPGYEPGELTAAPRRKGIISLSTLEGNPLEDFVQKPQKDVLHAWIDPIVSLEWNEAENRGGRTENWDLAKGCGAAWGSPRPR